MENFSIQPCIFGASPLFSPVLVGLGWSYPPLRQGLVQPPQQTQPCHPAASLPPPPGRAAGFQAWAPPPRPLLQVLRGARRGHKERFLRGGVAASGCRRFGRGAGRSCAASGTGAGGAGATPPHAPFPGGALGLLVPETASKALAGRGSEVSQGAGRGAPPWASCCARCRTSPAVRPSVRPSVVLSLGARWCLGDRGRRA